MKNKKKCIVIFGVMIFLMSALSIAASAAYGESVPYEPDGTTSTRYLYDSDECNRTIVVDCYDEDTGELIKTVNLETKRGEDSVAVVKIYGYRITSFSSDQGLWETCKLMPCSGLQIYGNIDISYYFRTALSKSTLTVTVEMERFDDITLIEQHLLETFYGDSLSMRQYPIEYSDEVVVNIGDYVSMGGSYTGFSIKSGWEQYISGDFSYKWVDDYENISDPIQSMEWDIVDATCDEDVYYNEFNEDVDGNMTYCTNREMEVDFKFARNKYKVSFNANSGSGSLPSSQTQYYGYAVTIGTEKPTRSGYVFKGWSKSSTAMSASYSSGSNYTMGLNTTLYAVWVKQNYDFSVSMLSVTVPDELFPNTTIPVRVQADNWDKYNAYQDIPISLYYDGKLLSTKYIDFSAYGLTTVRFDLNVGAATGDHNIEIRINWSQKGSESNSENNSVQTKIKVISDSYDFVVESLSPNGKYKSGTEVVTSYLIYNDSDRDVVPDAGAIAKFTAYYYSGSQKVEMVSGKHNIVIPKGESNLAYFKWSVPKGLNGKTVYCKCSINLDGKLKEGKTSDNTATFSTVIANKDDSQTTNPDYESQAPNNYYNQVLPSTKAGSASWTVWEYSNGNFTQKKYGVSVSTASPRISPGIFCGTVIYSNGSWTMKSGYGFSMTYSPYVTTLSGCSMPQSSAYTDIQTVYATLPEKSYSNKSGEYRVLEYYNSYWRFIKNNEANREERLHYIPLWYDDGDYTISVTVTDVWTPSGVITAVRSSNTIYIDGSLYDDWYQG